MMQSKSNEIIKIALEELKESDWQGRMIDFGDTLKDKDYENIRELADSIYRNDLLNPVVVRKLKEGYEIIDGHRRVLAYKSLRRESIEAIVIEAGEKEAQALSVIGNLQRENLTNIEMAIAYKKILDAGLFRNRKDLADALGKDKTFVGDVLNTLDMDKRIVEDLIQNKTTNDVRLLKIVRQAGKTGEDGNCEEQWQLYRKIIENNLNRKEARQLLEEQKPGNKPSTYSNYSFKINRGRKKTTFEIESGRIPGEKLEELLQAIENFLEK